MFEAYITNTALYPLMGIEVGTTVHFPMTTQELQAALAKIGIDGKRYSEVFFVKFGCVLVVGVLFQIVFGRKEGREPSKLQPPKEPGKRRNHKNHEER